ncbi:MAG TPA: formimidoylglutamate deiminase [Rhizomicrobium sp.]|jgi:formiminoglutamate deiminase|nr:formimidoylglutamate deiminase [Rhizomicrobium sp.]
MLWFETVLLPAGWARGVRITLDGGVIAGVETGVAPAPGDERHAIAVPGLCNVHSHAFQRGMAGLAETRGPADDNFWTWREIMYRFLDRLTPDDVEAIAALAYVEMLESGFTRVGEFHYLHQDPSGTPYGDVAEMAQRIAAAAAETGIGLTLLPVFYAHGNFGGAPPVPGQRRFLNDIDSFARLIEASRTAIAGLPGANLGVAPHSLRAATPEELSDVISLADGGPVHIHAAEQMKEVEDCLAWSRARPVEWLLDHADVNRAWCLVHATHMTVAETARLAASGAVPGLCPITEANLGDGVFPAETWLRANTRFGIGTDSNVRISAGEELRALEYAQRLARRARNLWPRNPGESAGRALFDGALAGGAQALAQSPEGLCVGASGDLVSFDSNCPALASRTGDAILDSWIFAGAVVDCVWRQGRKLVIAGRHVGREAVAVRHRGVLERLLLQ